MISAKEAKELSEEAINEDYEKQMDLIDKKIRDASSRKLKYVTVYGYYSNSVIMALKTQGYDVKQDDSNAYHGPQLKIDWSQA